MINSIEHSRQYRLNEASRQIAMLAELETPIILQGFRETGKKWVAEAIHDFSSRNMRSFMTVECKTGEVNLERSLNSCSINRSLKDTLELIDRGLGDNLKGGSVLINNITELDSNAITKLINDLEQKLECRLIENHTVMKSNLGLATSLSETDQPMVSLVVPPLRDNANNIQFFANYFLAKANIEWARNITGISPAAIERILNYSWPGNLGELREVIYQSVLVADDGEQLPESALPLALKEYRNTPASLKVAVIQAEYNLIRKALDETKNNKRRAAAILNISRKTLYSKIRIYQESMSSAMQPAF